MTAHAQRINLDFDLQDHLQPCPFCGMTCTGGGLTLNNTHTAYYWITCTCGVVVHGKAYGTNLPSNKRTMRHHKLAKKSAIAAWNRRTL